MEEMSGSNVMTNGTEEIPAKHHKSSGISLFHEFTR